MFYYQNSTIVHRCQSPPASGFAISAFCVSHTSLLTDATSPSMTEHPAVYDTPKQAADSNRVYQIGNIIST